MSNIKSLILKLLTKKKILIIISSIVLLSFGFCACITGVWLFRRNNSDTQQTDGNESILGESIVEEKDELSETNSKNKKKVQKKDQKDEPRPTSTTTSTFITTTTTTTTTSTIATTTTTTTTNKPVEEDDWPYSCPEPTVGGYASEYCVASMNYDVHMDEYDYYSQMWFDCDDQFCRDFSDGFMNKALNYAQKYKKEMDKYKDLMIGCGAYDFYIEMTKQKGCHYPQ